MWIEQRGILIWRIRFERVHIQRVIDATANSNYKCVPLLLVSYHHLAMRITLLNLTQSPILYHTSSNNDSDAEAKPPLQIALLPSSSTTTELPKRCTKLTLIPRDELVKHESDTATVETDSHTQAKDASREFNLDLKAFQRSNVSDLVEGSPWRMYRSKVRFPAIHFNIRS